MAVLIPPSISSLAASNALAGIGAPAPVGANRSITPVLPGGVPASTSVFLSEAAQRLLTQLAEDPTLDIDTAFAEIALDLTQDSALESQLFSRTGLLQPTLSAPLLARLGDTDAQALTDTAGFAADQARLSGEQSLTGTRSTAASVNITAPNADTPGAIVGTANQLTTVGTGVQPGTQGPPIATTPVAQPAPVTPAAPPTLRPAAGTPAATPVNAAPSIDTAAAAAQTLADAVELDPFQQAALIAGLTTFGREQNNSLTTPPDTDERTVGGIAAIRPVEQRRDDSTEAWLSTRR